MAGHFADRFCTTLQFYLYNIAYPAHSHRYSSMSATQEGKSDGTGSTFDSAASIVKRRGPRSSRYTNLDEQKIGLARDLLRKHKCGDKEEVADEVELLSCKHYPSHQSARGSFLNLKRIGRSIHLKRITHRFLINQTILI